MGADLGEAKVCQLAGLEGSTPEKGDGEQAKSDFSGGSCSSDRAKASVTDAHSACKAGGTKPQVTVVLREFLENTSILAKMRPGNDAKDFLGTLEYLGETENCPEDVEIIMPACLGGGAQPAEWEGST